MLQTCDVAGVLNTIPSLIASLESTLACQILTGQFVSPDGISYLVHMDVWRQTFDRIEVGRQGNCPCCGEGHLDFLEAPTREMIPSLCGRDAIQITPADPMVIPLEELEARLSRLGEVRSTPSMLTFRSGAEEFSLFRDGRAIIKGTRDEATARSIYARYIGL